MWRHANPLSFELSKQYQASCRDYIGIDGFLSRCHRAVIPAIMFGVDPQGDSRVSVGESGFCGLIG